MSEVGRAMARGAAWMVLMRLSVRALGLVSMVILARLLSPGDFGVVALALVFLAALEALSEFGFDLALIRIADPDRTYYDTVWTLSLIKGAVVALAMAALAVPAASLTGEPAVTSILLALAVLPLIEGLQNPGIVDFRREMRFDREFRFRMVERLAGFAVTLPLAVAWESYWALVAGMLAGRVAATVASYRMSPRRPRPDLSRAREILGFSRWIVASSGVHFLNQRMDDLVIGRLVGTAALGAYSLGKDIGSMTTNELLMPISRALYPGFARIADDREGLIASYMDVLSLSLLLGVPTAIGIALTADLIVGIALTPDWAAVAPIIAIFALAGAVQMVAANAHPVLLALGRPNLSFAFTAGTAAIGLPALVPVTLWYGAEGAAWSIMVRQAVLTILFLLAVRHLLRPAAGRYLAALWRPVLGNLAMAGAVFWLRRDLAAAALPASVEALLAVTAGAVTYGVTVLLLWWAAGRPAGMEALLLSRLRGRLGLRRVPAAAP